MAHMFFQVPYMSQIRGVKCKARLVMMMMMMMMMIHPGEPPPKVMLKCGNIRNLSATMRFPIATAFFQFKHVVGRAHRIFWALRWGFKLMCKYHRSHFSSPQKRNSSIWPGHCFWYFAWRCQCLSHSKSGGSRRSVWCQPSIPNPGWLINHPNIKINQPKGLVITRLPQCSENDTRHSFGERCLRPSAFSWTMRIPRHQGYKDFDIFNAHFRLNT